MKVIAFIEPQQQEVIEKILRHCGLWDPSPPRAPSAEAASVHIAGGSSDTPASASDEPAELTYVDENTFWSTL